MELGVQEMSMKLAKEILAWKYSAPYDFYNNDLNAEGISELLSGSYFAVSDTAEGLIGFFCIGSSAQVPNDTYTYSEDFADIGLGMKPDWTGKGNGSLFLSFVLAHFEQTFEKLPKRLTVAKFNQRAIRLYEKFGFREEVTFIKGSKEFIVMKQ